MKEITMSYSYQGKMDAFCEFELTEKELNSILTKLEKETSVDFEAKINCFDLENNLISTAKVLWQIKPWSKTNKQS